LKRSAVVIAGPAINYIFAFILMVGLFAFNGQPITPPVAAAVVGGSSADKSGFQPHDVIISIDDKPIASFEDVRREMMIALDTKKHFVVERDGELVDIFATPDKVTSEDRFGFKQSRGLLGLISPRHAIRIDTIASIDGQTFGEDEGAAKRAAIAARFDKTFTIETPKKDGEMDTLTIHPVKEYNMFMEQEDSERYGILFVSNIDASVFVKHGFVRSSAEAGKQVWVVTRGTLEALGQMITGTRSATELGGIIRIGALAGDMAKQGLVALIMFTALLSINLGLVNMFPIPMLDGGHLMFYFFEALRGKPVPEHVQEYAFRIGLVFLVGIMAFANLNDIMQLIL
jgi:regulator of sigma E protease